MKTWKFWLLISCVPLYGFGIIPLNNELSIKKEEFNTIKVEFDELQAELKKSRDQAKNTPEFSKNLLLQIPEKMEQEQLIRDIKRITKDSGFSFDGLSFGKSYNSTIGAKVLTMSLAVEGPKKNAKNLLTLIEKNERFMGMESLGIGTSYKNGVETVSLGLALYTYFQD